MELITLTRTDPEFESYLLGTFSKTHRALPVETYQGHTTRERVTFQIVPVEGLKIPAWWKIYARSSRPELLALTLGPACAAWLNHHYSLSSWTRWPSWFALAGVFFVHTAVFLFNDVQDHVRGADRLNRRRGSQVIQKGWVRAADMRRWAWVNAALAVGFAVPAFLNAPAGLALVCMGAAAALAAVLGNWGTRWGLCDFALFLLFGPLLTVGTAFASFGDADLFDTALGFAFGLLALWVFQVRQFENLFRSQPGEFRTFLGYLGFDRARLLVIGEAVLLLAIQPTIAIMVRAPLIFLALSPLVSLPLILTVQRFVRAASPLSSDLVHSSRWALISHLAWALWWIAALGVSWL